MISGGFERFGYNDGDFQYNLNNEKFKRYASHPMLAISFENNKRETTDV